VHKLDVVGVDIARFQALPSGLEGIVVVCIDYKGKKGMIKRGDEGRRRVR